MRPPSLGPLKQSAGRTCFIVEDVGPLQTLLDVLLLHHHPPGRGPGPAWRGHAHPGLQGHLQAVEARAGVAVTQVGHGVQSPLLDEDLRSDRGHTEEPGAVIITPTTGGRSLNLSCEVK